MMMKVMIVDDDGQIREGIRRAVKWQELGIDLVRCYANGREALEAFPDMLPDLLICDIEMPKMSGLELGEQIRTLGLDTRIIYLTAFSEFEYARGAMQVGACDYILKPVKITDLTASVRKNIEQLEKFRERQRHADDARLLELTTKIYHSHKAGYESQLFDMLRERVASFESPYLQTMLLEIDSIDGFEDITFLELEKTLANMNCVMLPFRMNQKICLGSGFHSALFNLNYRSKLLSEIVRWNVSHTQSGFSLRAGISLPHQTTELYRGYEEARMALDTGFYNGETVNVFAGSRENNERDMLQNELRTRFASGLDTIHTGVKKAALLGILEGVTDICRKLYMPPEKYQRELMKLHTQMAEQLQVSVDAEQLYESFAASDSAHDCMHLFCESLEAGIRHSSRSLLPGKPENTYSVMIAQALQYLGNHYAEPLSVSRVAEYVGKSDNHFSATFKKETGLSFTEYLTRLRIEHACRLLRHTSRQVKEVCNEVGFSDYLYFSKIFKKVTGCTPSDIRREKRQEELPVRR